MVETGLAKSGRTSRESEKKQGSKLQPEYKFDERVSTIHFGRVCSGAKSIATLLGFSSRVVSMMQDDKILDSIAAPTSTLNFSPANSHSKGRPVCDASFFNEIEPLVLRSDTDQHAWGSPRTLSWAPPDLCDLWIARLEADTGECVHSAAVGC
jgi:hypothetical protein